MLRILYSIFNGLAILICAQNIIKNTTAGTIANNNAISYHPDIYQKRKTV